MDKRIILITGASSGLGKISASELIRRGHVVYCAARSVDKMKDLQQAGGRILSMDVSQPASMESGVRRIIDENGKLDVLWNNAGYGLYGPVEQVPIDKAKHQLNVNLIGLAQLTQFVLPHMREKRSGLIINTSSMGGKIYTPLGAWYHATKHAVEGFSDCLRLELKEFGIKVVVLEPGLIDTGFSAAVETNFPKETQRGPYRTLVNAVMRSLPEGYKNASDPMIVANTIVRIVNARNPRTRYLVGRMARLLVGIRRVFGDRIYDRLVMSQVNKVGRF